MKISRPTYPKVPRFPEEADLVKCLQRLHHTYNKVEGGYRDKLYAVMKRCYAIGLAIEGRPDEFERLRADPYWLLASRKLPTTKGKTENAMRWVVFFTVKPVGKSARDQVGRWAKVLCHFRDIRLPVKSVVPRLKDGGGVKGTVEDILEKNSGAKSPHAECDTSPDAPQEEKAGEPVKGLSIQPAKPITRMIEIETRSLSQQLRALTPGRIKIVATVTEGERGWKHIEATQIRNL